MTDTAAQYQVTCPVCGDTRSVNNKSYYNAIMRGKESSKCRSCGRLEATKRRLAIFAMRGSGKTMEACGCVLTCAAMVFKGGVEISVRCKMWDGCGNQDACLMAIYPYDWPGFTADCKGFTPRGAEAA
jgi:hypothetical protein